MENLRKVRYILPSKVRRFRILRNISQEQLAEKVNIHPTYISRIESGKKLPTLPILCKIADILDVNLYEIFVDDVKIKSLDYKRRRLIDKIKETRSSSLDIYTTFIDAFHRRDKRKKK
jgi:transcriptional regulator with XRE-family HTH domain